MALQAENIQTKLKEMEGLLSKFQLFVKLDQGLVWGLVWFSLVFVWFSFRLVLGLVLFSFCFVWLVWVWFLVRTPYLFIKPFLSFLSFFFLSSLLS